MKELLRTDFTSAVFVDGLELLGVRIGDDVSFEDARFLESAAFDRCAFGERVVFRRATFEGDATFKQATFGHRCSFSEATFARGLAFNGATLGGGTSFTSVRVEGDTAFKGVTFGAATRLDGVVFAGRTDFRGAVFGQRTSFRKATFGDKTTFEQAKFGPETSFSQATFGDDTRFADAEFGNGVSFRKVTFGELAGFERVSFGDRAWFTATRFGPRASFASARFAGQTAFSEARFEGPSKFEDATFAGRARFGKCVFVGRASFRLANFERARTLGPLTALGLITFDEACFTSAIDMHISADRLSCVRTTFREGVNLYVRWAQIALDLGNFGGSSLVTAAGAFPDLDESELSAHLDGRRARPSIVSLRGAHVAGLTVANVDLRTCRFVGAHGLERLQLEGESGFSTTPRGRSRRQIVAEEQAWRASRPSRFLPAWPAPERTFAVERVERVQVLKPHAIAAIYRALRKGREDEGDAPGAADFYYGEMEMRRLDERASRAERTIVTLYWLVAGYGLRGLRALVALFATIALFAFLFWRVGFTPRVDFTRALLFSAESTSSLFRVPETQGFALTRTGEALQMGVRLLGPLFFGLALLSLRGRVKR